MILSAIEALSAPKPPAEAQCGGEVVAEVKEVDVYEQHGRGWHKDARILPTGHMPDVGTKLYTAPPSAPVGVEEHEGAMTSADYIEHCAGVLREHGYRVTASTLADIATEHRALAQQPASDGGFTAADMMDARQEGRKEAQQPAAVDGAGRVMHELCDCPNGRAEHAEWCAALAAQQGGRSDD